MEDIRCGVYVIKVTDKRGNETLKTIRFDEKEQDGGDIVLKGQPDYYLYIYENLLPKLGYADLKKKKETLTSNNYDKKEYWDERTGLVSADITDFNGDGIDDLVVQYFKEEQQNINGETYRYIRLYAELYSINEKGDIYLVGTQEIGGTRGITEYHLFSGIVEMNEKTYFFVQDDFKGIFIDGGAPSYTWLEFDSYGNWNVKYRIGQTEPGTSELSDTLWEYENGKLEKETIIWAQASSKGSIYWLTNPEEVIVVGGVQQRLEGLNYGLSVIGMNTPISGYSFRNNPEIKQSLNYDIVGEGDYIRTEFVSELVDKTGLKENLKPYEYR